MFCTMQSSAMEFKSQHCNLASPTKPSVNTVLNSFEAQYPDLFINSCSHHWSPFLLEAILIQIKTNTVLQSIEIVCLSFAYVYSKKTDTVVFT